MMYGESAGDALWEKSLENSSNPVKSLLLRGLRDAVLMEVEPVRECVAEAGELFMTVLYRGACTALC